MPCSEALLNAALAGSYGVPVVLITGDRTIVDETTRAMPWAVGVAVKDADRLLGGQLADAARRAARRSARARAKPSDACRGQAVLVRAAASN